MLLAVAAQIGACNLRLPPFTFNRRGSNLTIATRLALLAAFTWSLCDAQSAYVRKAPSNVMPILVDSNSLAWWRGGQLHLIQSSGTSLLSTGANQFYLHQGETEVVDVEPYGHEPIWIEAVWPEDEDTLWAWYHHEPGGLCPGSALTAPEIGALVSHDGGHTFTDLGLVLVSGEVPDCSAKNGFFAGGHGDFSVIPSDDGYLYFLFGNYGGVPSSQGVSMARMAWADRANPVGAVFKYHDGAWTEPGLGGAVAPVFPATTPWGAQNTDSYWGPSIHWNHHIQSFVVLMSRSCCAPRWPQEGIYVAFNQDLSDPAGWSQPERILSARDIGFSPGWYPQVLGAEYGETDTVAGEVARLYIKGISNWEIVFGP